MKTNVRNASLDAHEQNKATGLYAKQTSEGGAGIRLSSVTRALEPLLVAGEVVELPGLAPCPISKRRVGWLAYKDRVAGVQLGLGL